MSTLRSPPQEKSESQPDLSRLPDDACNINFNQRKRKSPDCQCNSLESFTDFRNNMMDFLKSALGTHTNEIKSSFDALRNDLSEFKQDMSNLTLRINELSEEQLKIKDDVRDLKSSSSEKSRLIKDMAIRATELQISITELSEQLQAKEQQERINNIEITGLPVLKGENLMNTLNNISAKIGFPLKPYDIDYVHRVRRYVPKSVAGVGTDGHVPPPTPNIIVRFIQRSRKNEMLAAVRARRGLTSADAGLNGPATPIFINDHLTPQNKLLYKQARLTAKEKGYKYVWLSECKILLRKSDNSKVVLISKESDLLKIK